VTGLAGERMTLTRYLRERIDGRVGQ